MRKGPVGHDCRHVIRRRLSSDAFKLLPDRSDGCTIISARDCTIHSKRCWMTCNAFLFLCPCARMCVLTPHYPITSVSDTGGALAMYEPIGLQDDVDADIISAIAQLHEKAFAYYRQRRFAKAAQSFCRAKHMCHQNPGLLISPKPSTILHQRCVEFVARPPPLEWISLSQWTHPNDHSNAQVV